MKGFVYLHHATLGEYVVDNSWPSTYTVSINKAQRTLYDGRGLVVGT